MKHLLHIGLLLMAFLGLMGQSTAMAMAMPMLPARITAPSAHGSMQASMAEMDCIDMANAPASGKPPCKKVTLQCMAAMGCSPLALVEPKSLPNDALAAGRDKSALSLAARLWGRSYGPEPDPPNFLI